MQFVVVAVLGVLDQEHHQEGDDGGRGVDHQLPGVVEVEQRPGNRPSQDQQAGHAKGHRPAGTVGQPLGETVEFHPGALPHSGYLVETSATTKFNASSPSPVGPSC
ncbi:hypothetical protein D3C76_1027930 [compost metagenome]